MRIRMANGDWVTTEEFRPIFMSVIAERNVGLLFNPFEGTIVYLEDVHAYEDENGNMVTIRTAE